MTTLLQLQAPDSSTEVPAVQMKSTWRAIPASVWQSGERAAQTYVDFFAGNLRNANTREAYMEASFAFLTWTSSKGFALKDISPGLVGMYLDHLSDTKSIPTVKLQLSAIRHLFDVFVVKGVLSSNPATSVRGPNFVVDSGKTPVLGRDQVKEFLNCDVATVEGLRNRALLGTMLYTFARIGAALKLKVADYFHMERTGYLQLMEKGGKARQLPVHHKLEEYLDQYLKATDMASAKNTWLFRATNRGGALTESRLTYAGAYQMISRRAAALKIENGITCHSFRATGITLYLSGGGSLEHAQWIAGHSSPRTTKLYDRRGSQASRDEVERIIV